MTTAQDRQVAEKVKRVFLNRRRVQKGDSIVASFHQLTIRVTEHEMYDSWNVFYDELLVFQMVENHNGLSVQFSSYEKDWIALLNQM